MMRVETALRILGMGLAAMLSFFDMGLLPDGGMRLIEARRVWDRAEHQAFTDLARHRDLFWCVFREGTGHVSADGVIRVLRSADGREWSSAAVLRMEGVDLRDPKITVSPAGELMILAGGALDAPKREHHQTYTFFSQDGANWSAPTPVGDADFWMWRVAWRGEQGLGVGYGADGGRPVTRLYGTGDGKRFETVRRVLSDQGQTNEAGLAFLPDGTCLVLLRRDGSGAAATGLLGRSQPPYREWAWKDLGVQIGGPGLLRLPDGRLIAGVRLYDGNVRTALCWLDADKGRLTEALALPSGGDTSYPGLVWHGGKLWVSYYASHEGKTSIYVAEVAIGTR